MESFVSFRLVWTCADGHEADTEVVATAEAIGNYVYQHADVCYDLTGRDCTEHVELDRIEPVENAADANAAPESEGA